MNGYAPAMENRGTPFFRTAARGYDDPFSSRRGARRVGRVSRMAVQPAGLSSGVMQIGGLRFAHPPYVPWRRASKDERDRCTLA